MASKGETTIFPDWSKWLKWDQAQTQLSAKELATIAKSVWKTPNVPQEVVESYRPADKGVTLYDLEHFEWIKGDLLELYEHFVKRMLNIDSSVRVEFRKLYIAFKSTTNICCVVPQKSRLKLSLIIDISEILDPKGLCRDIKGIGGWGSGDVEVTLSHLSELDDVMDLMQQAFDLQMEVSIVNFSWLLASQALELI